MENNYGLIKAFGPSIFKAKIPDELLNKLNKKNSLRKFYFVN